MYRKKAVDKESKSAASTADRVNNCCFNFIIDGETPAVLSMVIDQNISSFSFTVRLILDFPV